MWCTVITTPDNMKVTLCPNGMFLDIHIEGSRYFVNQAKGSCFGKHEKVSDYNLFGHPEPTVKIRRSGP
jgi:hypothetical protein